MKKAKVVMKPKDREIYRVNKVKITVVKTLDRREIHGDSDLGCSVDLPTKCPVFVEGQDQPVPVRMVLSPAFQALGSPDDFRAPMASRK